MEREQYFNLITALSNLSKNLVTDTIDDRGMVSGEDLLLIVFDIFPYAKSFFNLPAYHKATNKQKYKEESLRIIKHYLVTRHEKWFKGKYESAGNLILQSLFESKNPQSGALLKLPDTFASRYRAKQNSINDGKIILADIFNYWLTHLIENEVPEEYKGPKTIEVKVPTPKTKPSKYSAVSAKEEFYHWEVDIVDHEPDHSDQDIEFDDDGSNWAYNERHDD
jgi:hypothetical protein